MCNYLHKQYVIIQRHIKLRIRIWTFLFHCFPVFCHLLSLSPSHPQKGIKPSIELLVKQYYIICKPALSLGCPQEKTTKLHFCHDSI